MGEMAKCLLCPKVKILTCCGGSTSVLRKHLISVHNICFADPQEDIQEIHLAKRTKTKDNQHSILEFSKKQSLSEILARLAAEDGFSFLRIAQSKFIRSSLSAKGFAPPKSHSTISIREYSLQMKSCDKQEIAELLQTNARFSVSLDEYTSNCNRWYMNVNLHYKSQVWIQGLGRIFNSMPAEIAEDIMETKLREFGVLLNDDIVALVTDGASVMIKMRKLSKQLHQLCYAHAIHLAVCYILYDSNNNNDLELPTSSSEIMPNLPIYSELDEDTFDDMTMIVKSVTQIIQI